MLQVVERVARFMAIVGGLILTALVILTGVSVLGRGLNTLGHSGLLPEAIANTLIATGVGPVNGDFELVEAGVAFAIFAFLPICQLYGSHATVDVFTNAFSKKINRVIAAFWEVILAAVIVLITMRLFVGMQSKMSYGETTFLLQFPVWWAYAASFGAAVTASLVGLYCAFGRVIEMLSGRRVLPYLGGEVH